MDAANKSHRLTPVARSKLSLPAAPTPSHLAPAKRFNLFHVFVPSFLFVALTLAIATIAVLEMDCDLWSSVREWPEMVTLRREYYEPAKDYVSQAITKITS